MFDYITITNKIMMEETLLSPPSNCPAARDSRPKYLYRTSRDTTINNNNNGGENTAHKV